MILVLLFYLQSTYVTAAVLEGRSISASCTQNQVDVDNTQKIFSPTSWLECCARAFLPSRVRSNLIYVVYERIIALCMLTLLTVFRIGYSDAQLVCVFLLHNLDITLDVYFFRTSRPLHERFKSFILGKYPT